MSDLAIITGASSGIGAALAGRLAAKGHDLLLVARRVERLEELAASLRSEHGREVTTLAVDVTAPDALERIQAAAPAPAVLVNNAGLGRFGAATSHPVAEQAAVIRLNCEALTVLTLGFVPGMVERGRGVVVNLGSIAGLQPVPYYAVYGASKAFVHSFSEALDEELSGTGVRVVTVAPGPVPTEFQEIAGSPDAHETPSYALRTPEQIADAIVGAIERPQRLVVPARYHWWMHFVQRFVPRSTVTRIAAGKMRKRVGGS
ncbi:MAG: SDR family NAD(P)-dependent oxidoreductase [Planctomycetota bacterium]